MFLLLIRLFYFCKINKIFINDEMECHIFLLGIHFDE